MPNASYFNDRTDAILFPDRVSGEVWTARTPGAALPKATDGTILLSYFTAPAADTIAGATVFIKTAQVTSPATKNLVGLYSEGSTGALTRVAVSANSTTLFDGTGAVTKAFAASVDLIPGQRYAFAVLAVGSVGPVLVAAGGNGSNEEGTMLATAPVMAAMVTGQTDLPATIAAGSIKAMDTTDATKPGQVIAQLA